MSLSPIKQEILESMFLSDKPKKAMEIAKEAKKEFQPVMMHLLGLIRMGYVASPEKGFYVITAHGKQALGIPEITKTKAVSILDYAPHDRAFHFYATVDKPLSVHAHNLRDFSHKVDNADVLSVEFHLKRGDFEAWFRGLGDEELVKKIGLLKKRNLGGEDLRELIHLITHQRYLELSKFAGLPVPPEEEETEEAHTHTHDHPHTHS
jgi:hypothetical protein